MNPIIIACDPGESGSIAWRHGDITMVKAMPETRGDCIELIRGLSALGTATLYIEKVSPYIPDAGASNMMEYGRQVERVPVAASCFGIKVIEVTPGAWQKSFQLGKSDRIKVPSTPKGATKQEKAQFKIDHADEIAKAKAHNAKAKSDWKNKLKGEAQRRNPSIKVTLKTADALLLLEYGLMQPCVSGPIPAQAPRVSPSEAGRVLSASRGKKTPGNGDNLELFNLMFQPHSAEGQE